MQRKIDRKKVFICLSIFTICIAIMCLMLFIPKAQPLSEKFDEELLISEAKQVVEYFNNKEYQTIIDMSAEELKSTTTVEEFAEVCDEPMSDSGEFVGFDKIQTVGVTDSETNEEYGGVALVVRYENFKLRFSIGFNVDMEICQFSIR